MDPNQPFFPVPIGARNDGITIYDWLAAVALQGLVAKGPEVKADRAYTEEEKDFGMALRAYRLADAMLRAREQVAAARVKSVSSPLAPAPARNQPPTRAQDVAAFRPVTT